MVHVVVGNVVNLSKNHLITFPREVNNFYQGQDADFHLAYTLYVWQSYCIKKKKKLVDLCMYMFLFIFDSLTLCTVAGKVGP